VPATASFLPAWPVLSVIASCMIFTGFVIAILAVLTHGFGALERFFTAALERSAARAEAPATMAEEAEPYRRAERGSIEDSVYHIHGDGSVEVETLLGSRRFASLREAQEFVGER
jgi:hypothetical protein